MRTVRCSSRLLGVSTQGVLSRGFAGGVCPGGLSGEGVSAQGGCLPWGVFAQGVIPACTEADTSPVDRILDTHLWKYYRAATSLRTVIKKWNDTVQLEPHWYSPPPTCSNLFNLGTGTPQTSSTQSQTHEDCIKIHWKKVKWTWCFNPGRLDSSPQRRLSVMQLTV